jgi:sugar/nucleoside kinase (ribokinase family)
VAEIAVLGTVAADVVVMLEVLPRSGDHVSGEMLGWRLGGSSANVACGLAAAGHDVELVGPVGDDATADALLAELQRRGVGTTRCTRVFAPAPQALILLEESGERSIVQLDRAFEAQAFPIMNTPDLHGADCVYVESYTRFPVDLITPPSRALLVATAPATGHRTWPADILVGSERQYPSSWLAAPFTSGRLVAGDRLRWVIVTRGGRGVDAYGPTGTIHVDSRPARQMDATGAGDAFVAGFVSGLLNGGSIAEALELGSTMGATAVESLRSVPPGWPGRGEQQ